MDQIHDKSKILLKGKTKPNNQNRVKGWGKLLIS